MKIPLATALNDSATTTKGARPHTFSIEFVLSSGELRQIEKATRFMKSMPEVERTKTTGRSFYNLKANDQILIRDTANPNGHPYPVNVRMITRYNHLIVQH